MQAAKRAARIGVPALVLALAAGTAPAAPVEVRFTPPEDLSAVALTWEALPIDIPEATGEPALAGSGGAVTGGWTVALEPGQWQVNGWNGTEALSALVTVPKEGGSFVIARQEATPEPPYRCAEATGCAFADAATGLSFTLPAGWAAGPPQRRGNAPDVPVTVVFFEADKAEGGAAWFLNPADWSDAFGACRDIPLGRLCGFSASDAAEAARAVIQPSLKLTGPEGPAQP